MGMQMCLSDSYGNGYPLFYDTEGKLFQIDLNCTGIYNEYHLNTIKRVYFFDTVLI